MTTIAWDGRRLAADTRYTTGSYKGYMRKILRLRDGSVLAFAGTVGYAYKLKDTLEARKPLSSSMKQKELEKVSAILIDKHGKILYLDHQYFGFLPVEEKYYAIGRGDEIAVAMMRSGASAEEAVVAVSKVNTTTNNVVDVYDTETQAFKLADFPE